VHEKKKIGREESQTGWHREGEFQIIYYLQLGIAVNWLHKKGRSMRKVETRISDPQMNSSVVRRYPSSLAERRGTLADLEGEERTVRASKRERNINVTRLRPGDPGIRVQDG